MIEEQADFLGSKAVDAALLTRNSNIRESGK
jgi:hypothetical protein